VKIYVLWEQRLGRQWRCVDHHPDHHPVRLGRQRLRLQQQLLLQQQLWLQQLRLRQQRLRL